MNVESLKISKVFQNGGDIHYVLPRFQREYAWEKTNWNALLEDIFAIYEVYDAYSEPEHFMGALVVISAGNVSGTIPAFKLVDGQQRLTTISLAMCALGNIVAESHPKINGKIRKMLINEDEQGDIRYKLLPTVKYDDRKTYMAIIDGQADHVNGTQSRIIVAYRHLYRQIEKRLSDLPNDGDIDPVEQLFLIFANSLQVVFIELNKRERPFEIFESLNAKGKPLTQPDLVRNYIAMMLPEEQQNDTFDAWVDIESRLRETRTVSRIGELTAFLRHYLAYRSGALPNKAHVYARFRDRIQRDIPQSDEAFAAEINALRRFANYYDRFLRPENEPVQLVRKQLERLQVVESATAYPFMLGLFEEYYHEHIERDKLVESLKVLENYLVRRFLAAETTGYTNKMFPILLRDVSKTNLVASLKQALLKRNYPSDTRIKNILPNSEIYSRRNNRERLVFVLEAINHYLSRGSDGHTVLADIPTVEHIMPQKLTTDWRQTLGQDSETTYRDLLHTIGNLTLVTQSWNTVLSNDKWPKKRKMLAEHALRINQMYFADITGEWDRRAIEQRAEWMTDTALQIWPTLGEMPVAVGYKGSTPESIVIVGEYYDVKSWRDVAREAVYFAVSITNDFEEFANNLQSTYVSREQRARAEQLPNGWWVYLNLSADSVMTLCRSIFETLGLDDEDWDVKLRD